MPLPGLLRHLAIVFERGRGSGQRDILSIELIWRMKGQDGEYHGFNVMHYTSMLEKQKGYKVYE